MWRLQTKEDTVALKEALKADCLPQASSSQHVHVNPDLTPGNATSIRKFGSV